MVQNFMGTSFRTKITTKNFFMTQSQKFVILSRKKKKSIKIFWKIAKNAKIFKIQMWVPDRNRPIFGRKSGRSSPVFPKFCPKFFSSPNLKNSWFYPGKSTPPPPPRFSRKTGGRQLYTTYPRYHLTCVLKILSCFARIKVTK